MRWKLFRLGGGRIKCTSWCVSSKGFCIFLGKVFSEHIISQNIAANQMKLHVLQLLNKMSVVQSSKTIVILQVVAYWQCPWNSRKSQKSNKFIVIILHYKPKLEKWKMCRVTIVQQNIREIYENSNQSVTCQIRLQVWGLQALLILITN